MEDGTAAALAFNDPQALSELGKPTKAAPVNNDGTVPGQWWTSETNGSP